MISARKSGVSTVSTTLRCSWMDHLTWTEMPSKMWTIAPTWGFNRHNGNFTNQGLVGYGELTWINSHKVSGSPWPLFVESPKVNGLVLAVHFSGNPNLYAQMLWGFNRRFFFQPISGIRQLWHFDTQMIHEVYPLVNVYSLLLKMAQSK